MSHGRGDDGMALDGITTAAAEEEPVDHGHGGEAGGGGRAGDL
jgi:hypothetical protein